MCYYLQVVEAISVKHNKDSSNKESSNSKSERSNKGKSDSSEGSNFKVDIKYNVKFKDC